MEVGPIRRISADQLNRRDKREQDLVAEGAGFEPATRFPVNTISSRAP